MNSEPIGAEVAVTDVRTGTTVFTGTTPTTVTLAASAGYFKSAHYEVTFSGSNGTEATVELRAGTDAWFIGNLLFGGIIGFLIVDPATGSMYKLDEEVSATLAPSVDAREDAPVQLQITTIDTLTEEQQARLIALN